MKNLKKSSKTILILAAFTINVLLVNTSCQHHTDENPANDIDNNTIHVDSSSVQNNSSHTSVPSYNDTIQK